MVTLYVEGGGDGKDLRSECRRGFREFLKRAGHEGNMPKVVACGSRQNAFESFCFAISQGEPAMLLVDSEGPVSPTHQKGARSAWQPWQHLTERDGWVPPKGARDTDCHLMVQVMESWFLADPSALKEFFGQGFLENALPAASNCVENIDKEQVYRALKQATQYCSTKGTYGKGAHSFKLLACIDPAKVTAASPWARRLIEEIKTRK